MQIGLFNWIRKLQRSFALAVVLSLCAPILVAALPTPALSAEQQLLADIDASYCGHPDQGGQKQGAPINHQCCILCGTSTHALATDEAPQLITPVVFTSSLQTPFMLVAQPNAPPDLSTSAPRGPPTI